jgi:hypothetical protein
LVRVTSLLDKAIANERDDGALNELKRQHMVTMSMLYVLRKNPYDEEAVKEGDKTRQLAKELRPKLDHQGARAIYISLTLLSIARNEPDLIADVIEDLERLANSRSVTDAQRKDVVLWLVRSLLRKCNAHYTRDQLDDAIALCDKGVKSAEEPETKAKLYEILWKAYDQKAGKVAGGEQEALRKAAIGHLQSRIAQSRKHYAAEFGELLKKLDHQYPLFLSDPLAWAKANWRTLLVIAPEGSRDLPEFGQVMPFLQDLMRLYKDLNTQHEARAIRFLQFLYRYGAVEIAHDSKEPAIAQGAPELDVAHALRELARFEGDQERFEAAQILFEACKKQAETLTISEMRLQAQDSTTVERSSQIETIVKDCKSGLDWTAEELKKKQSK